MALDADYADAQDDDEEAKYGATDLKGETRVSNQDGGVFAPKANNKQPSPKNSKQKQKSRGKKTATQAPEGKWKTFKSAE